jgi:hypothetical protein
MLGARVPIPHPVWGYLFVQLFGYDMGRAGSTDGTAIAEALSQTDGDFLIGHATMNPEYNHSFNLPVTIMQITGGEASFLTRRQPEGNPADLVPVVLGG